MTCSCIVVVLLLLILSIEKKSKQFNSAISGVENTIKPVDGYVKISMCCSIDDYVVPICNRSNSNSS